jgi:hypothetical protein
MQCGRIPNSDKLFRHSVWPNGFKKKKFLPAGLVKLYDQSDGSILASLAWQRFFPNIESIHGYGCRLARKQNEQLAQQNKFSDKTRRIYCGAYQFTAESIRALATTNGLEEVASADVIHHPEDGEIAHTDLAIRFNRPLSNIEGTKTAIMDRLWAASCGPLKHICSSDHDIIEHPNSSLSDGPAGPYTDTRTPYLRFWHVARLYLCKLFHRF